MKAYLVKSSLLLITLGGTITGLLAYNQILSWLGAIFNFEYYWIYVPIIFLASLFVARIGLRSLVKDLIATNAFSEISSVTVLKFFIGGLIGCYIGFSIVGTFLLILYLISNGFSL